MGVPPLLVVGSDLDQKARGHNNPELLAEYSSPAKSSHEVAISSHLMKLRFMDLRWLSGLLAGSFMLPPFAADPAGLHQHQSQGQTCVSATVAIAAAHWILEEQ
jgi:hypothetical protein